jgi:hypothetical protein
MIKEEVVPELLSSPVENESRLSEIINREEEVKIGVTVEPGIVWEYAVYIGPEEKSKPVENSCDDEVNIGFSTE